jgi:hypothetical protein
MKLICERTTFIPGFCVFLLHRNGFRRVDQRLSDRLLGVTRRYSEWLIVE